MSLTVSPRSFRASLLERFDNSSILMTPPRHSQQQQQQQQQKDKHRQGRKGEDVVIENSSLLGRFFDPVDMDTAGSGNATAIKRIKRTTGIDTGEIGLRSSNSRSFVLNFIDQCVANNVPESLIVEHVLFMIDAMQEQISMTEAMHARFQYDRLRDYEMSELTNMLERQQVYYDQKEQQERLQSHDIEREIIKEQIRKNQTPLFTHMVREGDISGDMTSQRNQMNPSLSNLHGRRHISPSSLNTNLGRGVRVAFTQTPHEERDKETSRTSRGITRTTFHHFMCPTDASNRKERRKYTPVPDEPQRKPRSREGSVYSSETISRRDTHQSLPVKKTAITEVIPTIRKTTTTPSTSSTTTAIAAKKAAAAWRGRQRILDGTTGISVTGSSTWSDDDDDNNDNGRPLPVNYRSSNSGSNVREANQRHQVEKKKQQKEEEKEEKEKEQQQQRPPSLHMHQWKNTSPPRDVSTGLMHPSLLLLSSPQRSGTEAEVLTHEIHSTKKDETSSTWMDTRNINSSLPVSTLLSVRNPSLYPSPHLQAYIEQSERRVREADRVLASIPGNKIDFHQFRHINIVESPLSADISDLSDD